MLKIVLDTNMFVSGFFFHGMVKSVFDLVLKNKLHLYLSSELKEEIIKKMITFHPSQQEQNELLLFLDQRGIEVDPQVEVKICRDPKDDFVLELAESAKADYIITRDRDLLDLPEAKWKKTKIVRPEEFLNLLRKIKLIN